VAQQAMTAQTALGGRFTLGIGAASKQQAEERMGIPWDRPFSLTRDFVYGLQPYHTRQEQWLAMLDTWGERVSHDWVTGDDELGRHAWFRHELRERDERYVLGVPCTTTMRALEAPTPAYCGRGRRPKAPWPSVTAWRKSLDPTAWRRFMVRDGEKGPVAIARVKRQGQTRIERHRTGPQEWLVVTRRPLADNRTLEPRTSRDATDHDARYHY
jgi:hypothetical protein